MGYIGDREALRGPQVDRGCVSWEETKMTILSRRSVLRSSLAAAAAGTLARPYIANAAATTAEVWWVQGLLPEDDVAFQKVVADYEEGRRHQNDLSITTLAPGPQKIGAA